MQKEYIKINHNDHRLYKGVKIEYFYNGTHREYQTSFGNIGRYGTLKEIQHIISKVLNTKKYI